SRLWNCRANRSSGPRRRGGARRFGPYLSRRRAASSLLSPLLSEASCRPTTSGGEACHEACCLVSDISASLAGGVQVEDIPSLGTIRTRGGCSYRGRGGTFNVGAPSRCERPGHDMTLVGATPNEAAPRSMYEHRPRCEGPHDITEERATLPKRHTPIRCRTPRPGCEGVRHQIPPAASNIPARLTWINSIQFIWLYNP